MQRLCLLLPNKISPTLCTTGNTLFRPSSPQAIQFSERHCRVSVTGCSLAPPRGHEAILDPDYPNGVYALDLGQVMKAMGHGAPHWEPSLDSELGHALSA